MSLKKDLKISLIKYKRTKAILQIKLLYYSTKLVEYIIVIL